MGNKCAKFLVGLTIGAAAGYVAGTLLASKPGEETIEDLKTKAKVLTEKAQEKQEELRVALQNEMVKRKQELKTLSEKATENATILKESVIENVAHLKENVTDKFTYDEVVSVKSFKDENGG